MCYLPVVGNPEQAPTEEIPENSPWSMLLVKSMPNLTYTVWKRPFRNGLNEFKSTMEISGVTAKQVYDFQVCPSFGLYQ